jgi:hypothetical protein
MNNEEILNEEKKESKCGRCYIPCSCNPRRWCKYGNSKDVHCKCDGCYELECIQYDEMLKK